MRREFARAFAAFEAWSGIGRSSVRIERFGIRIERPGIRMERSGIGIGRSGIVIGRSGIMIWRSRIMIWRSGILIGRSEIIVGRSGIRMLRTCQWIGAGRHSKENQYHPRSPWPGPSVISGAVRVVVQIVMLVSCVRSLSTVWQEGILHPRHAET